MSARIGEKAWRSTDESEEIARTYGDARPANGFHLAAADLYPVSQTSKTINLDRLTYSSEQDRDRRPD